MPTVSVVVVVVVLVVLVMMVVLLMPNLSTAAHCLAYHGPRYYIMKTF